MVAQARGHGKAKGTLGTRIWENVKSLAGAVLSYLVIKTFLMEAFRIPSGSMPNQMLTFRPCPRKLPETQKADRTEQAP